MDSIADGSSSGSDVSRDDSAIMSSCRHNRPQNMVGTDMSLASSTRTAHTGARGQTGILSRRARVA